MLPRCRAFWFRAAVRISPALSARFQSIVVQDRADVAVLGEQGIAAQAELIEVERLIGLPLAVALDFDGDGLDRLDGGEGQRAGLGDVVFAERSISGRMRL
jgi:hypothetical protein